MLGLEVSTTSSALYAAQADLELCAEALGLEHLLIFLFQTFPVPGLLACATAPSFYSLHLKCAGLTLIAPFQVPFPSGKLASQAKPGGGEDGTVPQDGSLSRQKEEQLEGSSKVQKGDLEKPRKEAVPLKM